MHPSAILFEKRIGKNGKPLFESQTDLVRAITDHEASDWKGKNFNSVRAFVNQVINGERKLSEKLKRAIFLVLTDRINDLTHLDQLKVEIEQAFHQYFDSKKELKRQAMPDHVSITKNPVEADDFYLLEKRGLLADSVVITTRKPEVISNLSLSNELKKQMLMKLGVIQGGSSENATRASYQYFFPHPDKYDDMAFRFWKGLYTYLKYDCAMSTPEDVLIAVNEGLKPTLQVFSAAPILSSFPMVIYDMETRAEVAFTVFDYEDKGLEKVSTARISPSFLHWWKADIYSRLNSVANPSDVREVKFRAVFNDIRKNEAFF